MKEFMQPRIEHCDIEYIVLDFDGVLYSAPTFDQEYAEFLIKTIRKLSVFNWPKRRIRKLLVKHNIIDSAPDRREDIRKYCESSFGISLKTYDRYRLNHYFLPKKSPVRTLAPALLRALADRYHLILVANDSIEAVQLKAQILGIDLSVFDNVYTPTRLLDMTFTKYHQYFQIINNYILDGLELYALGTHYDANILPILNNGGSGLLVDPQDCTATERYLIRTFLLH